MHAGLRRDGDDVRATLRGLWDAVYASLWHAVHAILSHDCARQRYAMICMPSDMAIQGYDGVPWHA